MNGLVEVCLASSVSLTDCVLGFVIPFVAICLLHSHRALYQGIRDRKLGHILVLSLFLIWISVTLAVFHPLREWVDSYNKLGRTGDTIRAQLSNLDKAITLYRLDTGRLPSDLDDLYVNSETPGWSGPYLKSNLAIFDPWGNEYFYKYPDRKWQKRGRRLRHLQYSIWSLGADGVPRGVKYEDLDMDLFGVSSPSPVPLSLGRAKTFIRIWDYLPFYLVPIWLLFLVIKIIMGLVGFVRDLLWLGPNGSLRAPPPPVA